MKNLNWLFNMFSKKNNKEYDPITALDKFNMPKSRQEILRWVRIYFNTDPLINNIVTENATLAMPTFDLVTSDSKIGKFYNEMAFNDNFNLNDFMKLFSLSFHKFGEAIAFGNFEEDLQNGKWRWFNFVLLEPELVEIKTDMMIGDRTFELIPTEELKEMVQDPVKSKELARQVPELLAAVKEHRNIKLDSENISIVARLTDPSATRGTSPIQSCFKIIACMDDMRTKKEGSEKDWEFYKNQLSLGLKVNSAVSRSVRDQFTNWMLNKYFKPIAEKNGFRSKGKLILPTIRYK
jgi:hypothetical protein